MVNVLEKIGQIQEASKSEIKPTPSFHFLCLILYFRTFQEPLGSMYFVVMYYLKYQK